MNHEIEPQIVQTMALEAAYGSAVRALWNQPSVSRLESGTEAWTRRADPPHAGDPFGSILSWMYQQGMRTELAEVVHVWVSTARDLYSPNSGEREEWYWSLAVATHNPTLSQDEIAALDDEGASL